MSNRGSMGFGDNKPVIDGGTTNRGESSSRRIDTSFSNGRRRILLAYNAAGHQYLSTETIKQVMEWLPPSLKWMNRFLDDTATPTVYRDMTDVWTGAHWSDTPDAQRHHFMRTSEQTFDEAYKAAVDWIQENGRQASINLRRVWKEQLGYYDPLFVTEPLGDAFHALQDSFSEGHVRREKVGPEFIITAINVYDAKNKETHSELDKEWQSPLGQEAIAACRELTKIIIVSALRKTDAEFEERWKSLWDTFQGMFLQTKVAG